MPHKSLVRQFYPPFLAILVGALAASAVLAVYLSGSFYDAQFLDDLEGHARLLREPVREALAEGDVARVEALCRDYRRAVAARITVILPSGDVAGDSESPAADMENHGDRPEVRQALAGYTGRATRFSYTVQKRMSYVALPVTQNERVLGVVRLAAPAEAAWRAARAVHSRMAAGVLLIAVLAVGACILALRRIVRQIEAIRHRAERYARGEPGGRLSVLPSSELGGIAVAMNQMGTQLEERMQAVLRQRNELEGVLSSMEEAVLAFDIDQRIIRLNRAAAELFQVHKTGAPGRSVQEVFRNPDLERLVRQTLATEGSVEGEVALYHHGERVLQAHGTSLRDGRGHHIGGLVVLNDITRLRRLENARREFVANVSHEIRTPLTSIKGYVETLIDGAIDQPHDARRFLEIILRQANRLNALIDDLLTLARIEQDSDKEELVREPTPLLPLLRNVVQICAAGSEAKGLRVELVCPEDVVAPVNGALIEQAVVNLLDNAIKYSNPHSDVVVTGGRENGEVSVHVRDHGCGIDQDHIPRLFDRFYRVDRARSRSLGGTGLGLAIVKHIVRMHGGRIEVDSAPGRGSVFSIYLPAGL